MRMLALSLGERVASGASRARGYVAECAHMIPPRLASDPSPGLRRPVKAPVAVHPLPSGEGRDPIPVPSPRKRAEARPKFDRLMQFRGPLLRGNP